MPDGVEVGSIVRFRTGGARMIVKSLNEIAGDVWCVRLGPDGRPDGQGTWLPIEVLEPVEGGGPS